MRLALVFGLVTLFLSNICIADEVPATLRVDFFHSGNVEMEMFSICSKSSTRRRPKSPGRAASAAFTANGKPRAKRAA